MSEILLVGEVNGGNLAEATAELIAHGKPLAESLTSTISVALLDQDSSGAAQEAISKGADKVYNIKDSLLGTYQTDAYLASLAKLIQETNPIAVLVAKTEIGADIGARILRNMTDYENLCKQIMTAEKQYALTRGFWDD